MCPDAGFIACWILLKSPHRHPEFPELRHAGSRTRLPTRGRARATPTGSCAPWLLQGGSAVGPSPAPPWSCGRAGPQVAGSSRPLCSCLRLRPLLVSTCVPGRSGPVPPHRSGVGGRRLALSSFLAARLLCAGRVRAALSAGLPAAGAATAPPPESVWFRRTFLLDADCFAGRASCSEMRTLSLRDARSSLPGPALLLGTWVLGLWRPSQAVAVGSWAAAAFRAVGSAHPAVLGPEGGGWEPRPLPPLPALSRASSALTRLCLVAGERTP